MLILNWCCNLEDRRIAFIFVFVIVFVFSMVSILLVGLVLEVVVGGGGASRTCVLLVGLVLELVLEVVLVS